MTRIQLTGTAIDHEGCRMLGPLDLTIASGERLVLLGPSGSGKTTLLRTLAGLHPVADGTVAFDGRDVTRTPPAERDIAFINQEASLQPHLDVRRNLGFALRLRRVPRAQVRQRVAVESRAFSLGSLLPRRPRELSGGERHEVALARSLVRRASVLLMDEPFARIDPARRDRLMRELVRMQEGYGVTLVVATNDQRVAMTVADRVAVLTDGAVAQIGSPVTLYEEPTSLFVAGFLGAPPMNLLDGTIQRRDGRAHLDAGPFRIPTWAPELTSRAGAPIVLGVRPHRIEIEPAPTRASRSCRVLSSAFTGPDVVLHLHAPTGQRITAVVEPPGPEVASLVGVAIDPRRVHVFDPVDERVIAHGA